MRFLGLALLVFIIFQILRLDFTDGTIPLAAFMDNDIDCVDEEPLEVINVTIVEGDTIESLFALYPDSSITFIDRLSLFYTLNPHLQNQLFVAGEVVKIPLESTSNSTCKK